MDRAGTDFAQVWVGEILPMHAFVSPFAGAKFALMVAALEAAPMLDKVRLARSLIEQGCRYAVCAGIDCNDWETVFDDVDVEENPEGEASHFVMTTSHKGESLDEAAEFLFTCTAIEDRMPDRFVVLTVGGQAVEHEEVRGTIARVLPALPNPPLQRT